MPSLPIMLVLAAIVLAIIVKLLIPLCEKHEREVELQQQAAVKALNSLKCRVKPGIYTFRWEGGRMLEPKFEKKEGHFVIIRFVNGDRVTEKIQEMPTEFHRELLQLIRTGIALKQS